VGGNFPYILDQNTCVTICNGILEVFHTGVGLDLGPRLL